MRKVSFSKCDSLYILNDVKDHNMSMLISG